MSSNTAVAPPSARELRALARDRVREQGPPPAVSSRRARSSQAGGKKAGGKSKGARAGRKGRQSVSGGSSQEQAQGLAPIGEDANTSGAQQEQQTGSRFAGQDVGQAQREEGNGATAQENVQTEEQQQLRMDTSDEEAGQSNGQQPDLQATTSGQSAQNNSGGLLLLTTEESQDATGAIDEPAGQAAASTSGGAPTSSGQENDAEKDGKAESEKDLKADSEEDGKPNGENKRPRSSSGDEQRSPKRPKGGENTGQDGSGQNKPQQSGEEESCARLRQFIATHGSIPPPHPDPAPHQQTIADDDVYRAVVAVTEAISVQGFHQFTFIDWTSFIVAATMDREDVPQTVARPGNEILIPWIDRGHHSLFHLSRDEGTGQFRALHYDSARMYGHRANLRLHYDQIRVLLRNVNWTGEGAAGDAMIPDESRSVNSMRQQGGTQCGLHVIFNAWANALGLRITGQGMLPERYERFQGDGETLIRQAVQGNLPSQIIWAFFDCYDFIEPDQQIPLTRSFDRTVAFRDADALREYAARVRIEAELPGVDTVEAAREIVPAASTLSQMRTADFRSRYVEQQNALIAASQAATVPRAGAGSDGSAGMEQGRQEDGGSAAETQGVVAGDMDVSGTNDRTGQSSGTAGPAAAATGETTTQQTSAEIRSDAEAAEALQRGLDNGGAHQTAGSTDMQNGNSALQATNQTSEHHTTQTGGAGAETGATAPTTNQSGLAVTEQNPTSSDEEQQTQVPRTPQLLHDIPKFMKPGEQEHLQFTRERQEQRRRLAEEAQQRVEMARRLDEELQAAAMLSEDQDADAEGEEDEDDLGDADDDETVQGDQPRPSSGHNESNQAQDAPVVYVATPGAGTETVEEGETEEERMRDMFGDDWDEGGEVDRDDFDDIYENDGG